MPFGDKRLSTAMRLGEAREDSRARNDAHNQRVVQGWSPAKALRRMADWNLRRQFPGKKKHT